MKKIIVILISTLFLTGCFNYRDVNRVIFITSLGIDIDENNNPVLYAEGFRSIRGATEAAGEESRLVLTGTGETVFEAIRDINRSSSIKLNYTQNKAVIFSERAAEYGLNHFLDVLFRDQEFLVRQFLYISEIDMEELMKMELEEEIFLGIFLFDMAENRPVRAARPYMRIDEFYVNRKLGSKINGLAIISNPGNPFVDRIIFNGLGLMNEDKMISKLDDDETFLYIVMDDNLRAGYITVQNPNEPDKLVSLEILKSNTKTKLNYDGRDNIDITKEINIRTTLAEAQKTFTLHKLRETNMLEKNAEEKLKRDLIGLYEKYKKDDIDIFNLKKHVDIKYPNANINKDKFLNYVNLDIKIDVFIEGSTDTVNFY